MRNPAVARRAHSFWLVIAILAVSLAPAGTVHAQVPTTSDLAVSLVSVPMHVKACQTFEATYTVTNLGPDPASHLTLLVSIPDAYQDLEVVGLPESLAVGETDSVSVVIKVMLFEPGETRHAWVGVTLLSDYYLEPSIDPNPENSTTRTPMKIIGKHMGGCP